MTAPPPGPGPPRLARNARTYRITLATGAFKAEEGQSYTAGRMGNYTITKDPTRQKGLRVLMGPFSVYDKNNVEAAAK